MSVDAIAGSELPPRDAGLTDELPVVTVEFERTPWDPAAAKAWKTWQATGTLGPEPARRSLADRLSRWLCDRLPERLLVAVAVVCAWADGHEAEPRRPEPYRETYRPARYVGRAEPIEPRRYVSAVWLLASLWSEQGGGEHSPDQWVTAWNDGIPADYVGSHRRERAPGSTAQRDRSRVELQRDSDREALRSIDQRERMRMILVDPFALSRVVFAMRPLMRPWVEFSTDDDSCMVRIRSVA